MVMRLTAEEVNHPLEYRVGVGGVAAGAVTHRHENGRQDEHTKDDGLCRWPWRAGDGGEDLSHDNPGVAMLRERPYPRNRDSTGSSIGGGYATRPFWTRKRGSGIVFHTPVPMVVP
jgi:hypothetical protein